MASFESTTRLPDGTTGIDILGTSRPSTTTTLAGPPGVPGLVVVQHGNDPTVARPNTPGMVVWVGPVQPDNFRDGDEWDDVVLNEPTVDYFGAWRHGDILGSGGSAVALWADSSGHAHDLMQASSGLQPSVYNPGGLEPNSVFFNNAHSLKATFASLLAQPTTLLLAVKCAVPTSGAVQCIADGTDSTHRQSLFSRPNAGNTAGILRQFAGGSNNDYTVSDPTLQYRIITLQNDGASSFMRVNGAPVASGFDIGAQGINGITFGSRYAVDQFFTGYLCEARLVAGRLDTPTIAKVEDYLAAVVNIELTTG